MVSELNGIVLELDEDEYHAHPDLSSTQARLLLESPARYNYARSHPQERKDSFDLGSAVHTKVLGVGADVITYPDEHLRPSGGISTKAATVQWIADQRSAGLLLMTAVQLELVDGMAEAVLAHPVAKGLFEQDGTSEASVFATDPETGVKMRARFDFLPSFMQDNPWFVDLKTTAKHADSESFGKTVANFGYHVQQEWYRHAYSIVTGDFATNMKFVVVETDKPHLVAVHELSRDYAEIGFRKTKRALETYALCAAHDIWPGYSTDTDPLMPPTWLMFQEGVAA